MAVNGESFYARATIFIDSYSYESEPSPLTNQNTRKSKEQTGPEAKIFEIFDPGAVNFLGSVPIREYRGPVLSWRPGKSRYPIQN
jgi:hypothetical protein